MREITENDIVNGRYEGDLDLQGYGHPLPAALASVGGDLYLPDYGHPLPAALQMRR